MTGRCRGGEGFAPKNPRSAGGGGSWPGGERSALRQQSPGQPSARADRDCAHRVCNRRATTTNVTGHVEMQRDPGGVLGVANRGRAWRLLSPSNLRSCRPDRSWKANISNGLKSSRS